jgi:hypothetical protein
MVQLPELSATTVVPALDAILSEFVAADTYWIWRDEASVELLELEESGIEMVSMALPVLLLVVVVGALEATGWPAAAGNVDVGVVLEPPPPPLHAASVEARPIASTIGTTVVLRDLA